MADSTGRRRALLIGSQEFGSEVLQQLSGPEHDVAELAGVLKDPQIGGFETDSLLNPDTHTILMRTEEFFADSARDDLLLFYYSGHGIKDEAGQLYFAGHDTKPGYLRSTAMAATFLSEVMDRARSRAIVVILDCCYSGAFSKGMRAKAAPAVDLLERLEGRGRVIMTSSSSMEYAFEGDQVLGETSGPSLFTAAIVRGLATGEADRDGDGLITVDELYDYVFAIVKESTAHQTPMRWSADMQGSIVIARTTRATAPAPPLQVPTREFNISSRAVSDLPSPVDRLGLRPIVTGLDALLNDPATTLPLAVAVTGPWGAGKSSMMLQLKNLLRDRREPHRWHIVDFPAWKYDNSERLWAALAKAIYEQPQRAMTRRKRLWFRSRLEWRRQAGVPLLMRGLFPLLIAVAALVVALVRDLGPKLAAGSAGAALVLSVAAVTARYWGLVGDPFKRAIEDHVKHYSYEGNLGFTAEADGDVQCLTETLLDKPGTALAVFVDDLDRCSSKSVVEVIEAINQIFNSVDSRPCVFVLGMDAAAVSASIDVAYGTTVQVLRERGSLLGTEFGRSFLSKIVQLTVAIPEPSERDIHRYLESVTGNNSPDEHGPAPTEEEIRNYEEEIEKHRPKNPVDAYAIGANLLADPRNAQLAEAVEEAVKRIQARRFTADSPDVARAEFEVLRYLDRNPRQIKRFDNAFRLQLYVACSTPRVELDFSVDQLIALGKWVALRLRWPAVAAAVDSDPELLPLLEAQVNEDTPEHPLLGHPGLVALLREEVPARRMSSLPLASFLRIT